MQFFGGVIKVRKARILLARFFKICCILLSISATAVIVNSQRQQRGERINEYNRLNTRIEAEHARHQSLELEREHVLSDSFVERIAREQLGLVRAGDIIFHNVGE